MEAKPLGLFSRDFALYVQGQESATLQVSAWRDAARIRIDETDYVFERERLLSGAFLLKRGGEIAARAVKPSFFGSRFELEYGGERYRVEKLSAWKRTFVIRKEGRRLGEIRPAGLFTRRAYIDLRDCLKTPSGRRAAAKAVACVGLHRRIHLSGCVCFARLVHNLLARSLA